MNLPLGMFVIGDVLPNAVSRAVWRNLGKKSWGSMSPVEQRFTAEVIVRRARTPGQVRKAFKRIELPPESVLWVEYDLDSLDPDARQAAEEFLRSHQWNLVSPTGARVLIRYDGKRH